MDCPPIPPLYFPSHIQCLINSMHYETTIGCFSPSHTLHICPASFPIGPSSYFLFCTFPSVWHSFNPIHSLMKNFQTHGKIIWKRPYTYCQLSSIQNSPLNKEIEDIFRAECCTFSTTKVERLPKRFYSKAGLESHRLAHKALWYCIYIQAFTIIVTDGIPLLWIMESLIFTSKKLRPLT